MMRTILPFSRHSLQSCACLLLLLLSLLQISAKREQQPPDEHAERGDIHQDAVQQTLSSLENEQTPAAGDAIVYHRHARRAHVAIMTAAIPEVPTPPLGIGECLPNHSQNIKERTHRCLGSVTFLCNFDCNEILTIYKLQD